MKKTQLMVRAHELNPKLEAMCNDISNTSMSISEFKTSDGFPLVYREWSSKLGLSATSIVVCLHGLHSHGEKFVLLADSLLKYNWNVISLDLRGHGLSWESPEQRGDITDFNLWIKDFEEFTSFIKEKYPKIPIHVVAESMGGAIAISHSVMNCASVRSLILLSPAVKPWPLTEVAMIQVALTRAIVKGVEKKSIHNSAKGRFSTHSKAYIEYQQSDPFRLVDVTPRYYYHVIKMLHNLKNLVFDDICPTLVFFGENDHIIDFNGIKKFIQRIESKDKLLAYIPKAYHELLTDPKAINYGIYEKIILWIKYFG